MKTSKGYFRSLGVFDTTCQDHVFTLGGCAAEHVNNLLIKQSLRASLSLLPDVVCDRNLYQVTRDFLHAVMHVDFLTLLDVNEKAYRLLIKEWTCFDDFKNHFVGSELQLLAPVVPWVRRMLDSQDFSMLGRANTWLRFLSKLSFEMKSLEDTALESYLQNVQRMSELDLDSVSCIPALAAIIRSWLSTLDLSGPLPVRHGPGSVSEGACTRFTKYTLLSVDKRLRLCLQGREYGVNLHHYYPIGHGTTIRRISRVVFVPKNARKLRTICMEPCSLQYVQQGVMRILYRFFKTQPQLRKHLFLHDSTVNQEYARRGSIDGSFCTIDLSAASDSVSLELVRRLFRGTTLYKWLIGARSDQVELPDGSIIDQTIYAPMGSALCFPIECLVFAAVVEYATRFELRRDRSLSRDWLVYGDDLVVVPSISDKLILTLNQLGFKVNVDKSFVDGPFRESCGKEYYHGVDVTPTYYRINPVDGPITPDQYDSICSSINLSGDRGFLFLRSYLIDWLRSLHVRIKGKDVALCDTAPFFTDVRETSPHVFSPQPTNFHLKKLWNGNGEGWQTWCYRHLSLRSRVVEAVALDLEDIVLYHEFLLERQWSPNGEVDDSTPYRLAKRNHAFCMVWSPSYTVGCR